jgi:hypothetical protein
MGRTVLTHGGSYDTSAQNDIIYGDPLQGPITLLTGTADAINPHAPGNYVVLTGSADGITIGAPTSVVDDGCTIVITSNTAYAHTVTSTGNIQTGAAGTGVLTFAAYAGASLTLRAYGGKWQLINNQAITITS